MQVISKSQAANPKQIPITQSFKSQTRKEQKLNSVDNLCQHYFSMQENFLFDERFFHRD